MDFSGLPTELILKIVTELPLRDHARCLLTSRQWERQLSPALYARLLPIGHCSPRPEEGDDQKDGSHKALEDTAITRKHVLQWAVEHGSLRTLRHIDEAEAILPIINDLTFTSTRLHNGQKTDIHPIPLLHLASLHGQHSIVGFLLDKGADLGRPAGDGSWLPIHLATTGSVVRLLVDRGSRLEGPGNSTPLIQSLTCQADASAVDALLQLGVDPNHVTPDGISATMVAIDSGNVEALRVLVEAGAHVTKPLPCGQHLLYRAIRASVNASRTESVAEANKMLQILLSHGAEANSGYQSYIGKNKRQCNTPYLLVAVMTPGAAPLVQTMLEQGADPHEPYSKKREALDPGMQQIKGFREAFAKTLAANLIASTIQGPLPLVGEPLVTDDTVRKLRLLVQYGCSIDAEIDGHTCLQYCLRQDGRRARIAAELIPHLLSLGAHVNHVDDDGNQPLHAFARHFYHDPRKVCLPQNLNLTEPVRSQGLTSLMQRLLDSGADVNATDAHGRTPLMLMCRQPPVIYAVYPLQALLGSEGVDVNAVDDSGCTALHHVLGTAATELTDECCWRVQMLLNRRGKGAAAINVNHHDHSGRTPLHLLLEARGPDPAQRDSSAIRQHWQRRRRALAMLIRSGANIRARILPSSGSTPFHDSPHDVEDVSTAHIFGPDAATIPATHDHLGDTPLHLACQGREPAPILEMLLRHGAAADVNLGCRRQKLTPLMMLVGYAVAGRLSWTSMDNAVQLLLRGGAQVSARDASGRTAWDIFLDVSKIHHRWVLEPYVVSFMPDMSDEERREGLGLGAVQRPSLSYQKI